jgi:hypothetical protein
VCQASLREVEVESLKASLNRLLSGLDARTEAEQTVLAGHTTRLSREAARLEVLQVRVRACVPWLLPPPACKPDPAVCYPSGSPVPCPLQSALLSERDEARLAVAMERQALDEARTARIKVRV